MTREGKGGLSLTDVFQNGTPVHNKCTTLSKLLALSKREKGSAWWLLRMKKFAFAFIIVQYEQPLMANFHLAKIKSLSRVISKVNIPFRMTKGKHPR